MSAGDTSLHLRVSPDLNALIERIAAESGASRSAVIRQALALMKVAHEAKSEGKHIGLVSDPDKLDTAIVGVL